MKNINIRIIGIGNYEPKTIVRQTLSYKCDIYFCPFKIMIIKDISISLLSQLLHKSFIFKPQLTNYC